MDRPAADRYQIFESGIRTVQRFRYWGAAAAKTTSLAGDSYQELDGSLQQANV
jgi:hypothetical protein